MLRTALEETAVSVARPGLPRAFGPYELEEEIGRGGMGVVYRARQPALGRTVAVKLLLAGAYASEAAQRRFQLEAAAAAGLQHPNIVAIHDYGECEGQPYYAMDLVPGRNLTELCAGRPLPAPRAAEILRQLAGAVHYAHQCGILHRDLKPSNVLIGDDERPRITDFGLAKLLGSSEGATLTGQMLGSPSYAAPEQAGGRYAEISVASDIYGLGALFYHLLTGRPPFNAATPTETLRLVLETDPPPPRLLNPALPRDLETICLKCLAKGPGRRYATAGEVAADVERFLQQRPIRARRPSALYRMRKFVRRHRVGVAAVAAIALSLVGGLITASTLFVRERSARQRAVVAEESEGRLRQQAEAARHLEMERVARTALLLAEQLFPQGRTAEGLAYLVQAARKDPRNPTIAPRLASVLTARNFLLPEGAPLQLGSRVLVCAFSPDGQRLRVLCENGTFAVVDLASGEVLRTPSPSPLPGTGWGAATTREGAVLCQDGVVRVFDQATARLVREIRFERRGIGSMAAGADSGVIWVRLEDESVVLADTATGRTRPLPWDAATRECSFFTRDGRWYVGYPEPSSNLDVRDMRTGGKRKTLALGGRLKNVQISPDGSRLVTLAAVVDGRHALQVWSLPDLEPLTEAQLVENSVAGLGVSIFLTFSPDSRWLLVATPRGKQVYALATGAKVGAHVAGLTGGELFSPDGRRFTSVVTGGIQLLATATGLPATPPMLHGGEIRSTKFSAQGDVLVTTCSDGFTRLWDTATGQLLAEPTLQQAIDFVADLSPDGSRLVISTVGGAVYRLRFSRGGARPLALPRTAGPRPAPFMPDAPARLLWLERDQAKVIDAASGREAAGGFTYPEPIGTLGGSQKNVGVRSDLRVMVVLTESGKWQTWELGATGVTRIVPLDDAPGGSGWICFSLTGDRVAIIADDDPRKVRCWDLRTGKPVGPPCVHEAPIVTNANPGAFSPDGRRLVAGGNNGAAKVWDVATGRVLLQLESRRGIWIRCVDYSPDGTRIVTANAGGETQLWDAATGRPASAVLFHGGKISSAVFSRDGKYLLTSSQGRTARVWDGHNGAPVGEPMVHGGNIRSAQFSADGTRVVTASNDFTARVWDVPTGQPLTAPMMHPNIVFSANFSPDGRFVRTETSGSPAGPAVFCLWSVPPPAGGGPAPEWLLHLATICAAKTINQAGQCVDIPEVVAQLDDVRRQLAALPDDAPFVGWGRWMLNDRADRSIAPGVTLTPAGAGQLAVEMAVPAGAMRLTTPYDHQ